MWHRSRLTTSKVLGVSTNCRPNCGRSFHFTPGCLAASRAGPPPFRSCSVATGHARVILYAAMNRCSRPWTRTCPLLLGGGPTDEVEKLLRMSEQMDRDADERGEMDAARAKARACLLDQGEWPCGVTVALKTLVTRRKPLHAAA